MFKKQLLANQKHNFLLREPNRTYGIRQFYFYQKKKKIETTKEKSVQRKKLMSKTRIRS